MPRYWIDHGPPRLPAPLDNWLGVPVPQLRAFLGQPGPDMAPVRIQAALVLAAVHTRPGGGPFSQDDRRAMRLAMLHDPEPAVRHACATSPPENAYRQWEEEAVEVDPADYGLPSADTDLDMDR